MPNQQMVQHAYTRATELSLSSLDARVAIQHAIAHGHANNPKGGIPLINAYLLSLVNSGTGS